MLADSVRLLDARGLEASPHIGVPGDYVFERAFVESFETAPVAPAAVAVSGDRC
jgi:hypothetical protein